MRRYAFWLCMIFLCAVIGCSSAGENVAVPEEPAPRATQSANSHVLWGIYQFTADPVAQTLEFAPIRAAEMHLNALPFLEPPAFVNLSLDSLQINGNIVDADIGLRHPFLGLDEFTGFDVCGIFIGSGSVTGFPDTGIRLAAPGQMRLLNPDGYSRWWNPTEFPHNAGMLGYVDGLLGTPDFAANFSATVNGYKYYCDDLTDPDTPLSEIDSLYRGMFSAGNKIIRHYTIDMGTGLVFNYAIDACWEFPLGSPPYNPPDDFSPAANRPEPWRIDAEISTNTLFRSGDISGGGLSLKIDVYDWYSKELDNVRVDSPGNFNPQYNLVPSGGGDGYQTYEVVIPHATPAADEISVLITAACEQENFGGFINGKFTSAYYVLSVPVGDAPQGELAAMGTARIYPYFDGFGPTGTALDPVPTEWLLTLDASQSTGPIYQYCWELSGDDLFDDAEGMIAVTSFPNPGNFVIKLKVTDGFGGENIYELPGSYEVVTGTYVSSQAC